MAHLFAFFMLFHLRVTFFFDRRFPLMSSDSQLTVETHHLVMRGKKIFKRA